MSSSLIMYTKEHCDAIRERIFDIAVSAQKKCL
jgi:hypothetical protein